MNVYGEQVTKLIGELSSLPGIGVKGATRLAFHIINMPEEKALSLADAISSARKGVKYCKRCWTLTDGEECSVCASPNRDHKTIMVVEDFFNLYHVLHGVINPSLGIGVSDIRLRELILRLEQEDTEELIIATNLSVEGEATAVYISKLVKPTGIKITRIASGVPVGGDLECVDEFTLLRALEGRVEL